MPADAARRRGPRTDVDVPSVLVDVAESMFGRDGVDAVSLRAVAREAGVAPAAVGYHFAAKLDLVAAVVTRRGIPVGDQVRMRLVALLAGPVVSPRDLVDAVLMPLVDLLNAEPQAGLNWVKIFTRLALEDDPIFHRALSGAPDIGGLFVEASARALPGRADKSVRQRMGIAIFSMLAALAGSDLSGYGRPMDSHGLDPQWVEELARVTTGGLQAG